MKLSLGLSVSAAALATRGSGGVVPEVPPRSFTLTAGNVADTYFGYGDEAVMGLGFGSISRQPFDDYNLGSLHYNTMNGATQLTLPGNIMSQVSGLTPVINGTPMVGDWTQFGPEPELTAFISEVGPALAEGVQYAVTWQGALA